jgi:hypothetical protein
MQLRELFDTSLPLEWDTDSAPDYTVARAYDRQGRLIEVNFVRNDDQLDLEFTRGGSMATTGHGDENLVFGTVMKAVRGYMRANPDIRVIYFTGAADRQALYHKLAQKMGSYYGFHRAAKPGGSVFKLVRGEQNQTNTFESLAVDVPNEDWLQDKVDYVRSRGPDNFGVPRHYTVTAYTTHPVELPVDLLKRLPGMKHEQHNVRHQDLEAIMHIMKDTGRLPQHNGQDYAPFIVVTHDGQAWVSEGNHRIMAAAKLGWDTLPVDIKYFEGGERQRGPLYPPTIGL